VKESFEIQRCEKRKQIVRRERLTCPKEEGSKERSNENGRRKIGRQSSCVFQAC